jgi:hypothetical protein
MVKEIVSTLTIALLSGQGAGLAAQNACHQTSDAGRTACEHGAQDDYWIAVGTCDNLSRDAARKRCLADANGTLDEAKNECSDQFAAHEDLCADLGQAPYDPLIKPSNFLSREQTAAHPNPYFPLVPGTQWVYQGGGETITVTVTDETREFLGVTATEVTDVVVDAEGEPVEDTLDWFAQDTSGNVWYFGELSKGFENGELVGIEGSWKAGADGAKPGIIMKAAPAAGNVYRQEFALGTAEDAAEVLSTTGSESVPAASCSGNCVVTRDFTPLEPGVDENKYYAPGVGLILEVDPLTGDRTELVSVSGG